MVENALSFWDANAKCLFNYEQHLASIHNTNDQTEASNITTGHNVWIGMNNNQTEGTWVNVDGTPWDYGTTVNPTGIFPWSSGQPDNAGTNEHCAHLWPDSTWNDRACNYTFWFLCNYPAATTYIFNDPPWYSRIPSIGNQIGTIDVLDEFYVEFDFEVHSWPSIACANILHIGTVNAERYPAIYACHDNGQKVIHSTFSVINDWNPAHNGLISSPGIHHYEFHQTQDTVSVYIDSVAVYIGSSVSHSISFNQPIYLGFGATVADVTLTNFVMTTNNLHVPNHFYYTCQTAERFTVVRGNWTMVDPDLLDSCWGLKQETNNARGAMVWIGDNDPKSLLWTDYTVEVDIKVTDVNTVGQAGLLVRAQSVCDANDCGNQYYIAIQTTANTVIMGIINNGWTTIRTFDLSTIGVSLVTNQYYLLRVEIIGATFTVYLNNKYLFTQTQSVLEYATGSIGFRTFQSAARFKNFRVIFPSDNQLITVEATNEPTNPSTNPTLVPTVNPTSNPTLVPTVNPTVNTSSPTSNPASNPTLTMTTFYTTLTPTLDPIINDCGEWKITMTITIDLLINNGINSIQSLLNTILLNTFIKTIRLYVTGWNQNWCLSVDVTTINQNNGNRRRMLQSDLITADFVMNELLYDNVFQTYDSSDFINDFKQPFIEDLIANNIIDSNTQISNDEITLSNPINIIDSTIAITTTETMTKDNSLAFFPDSSDGITIVLLCIIFLSILIILYGEINSKECNGSDDFRFICVILFAIYTWDSFSDILFCISLWNRYVSPNHSQHYSLTKSSTGVLFTILFVLSICFLILPMIFNFKELINYFDIWTKHPLHGERYKHWLDKYGTILFILSFICGSTFGSVQLVNSNLTRTRLFTMGLTRQHLRDFNQRRLFDTVLAENFPQLIISSVFAYISNGLTTIVFLAIMSSLISICVSLLDWLSKRKLMNDSNNWVLESLFSVHILSSDVNVTKYKYKTKQLGYEIAKMVEIDKESIEVLPTQTYTDQVYGDGLVINFCIITSLIKPEQLYTKLQDVSFLGKQIAKAWNIDKGILTTNNLKWIKETVNDNNPIKVQMAQSIHTDRN